MIEIQGQSFFQKYEPNHIQQKCNLWYYNMLLVCRDVQQEMTGSCSSVSDSCELWQKHGAILIQHWQCKGSNWDLLTHQSKKPPIFYKENSDLFLKSPLTATEKMSTFYFWLVKEEICKNGTSQIYRHWKSDW